MVKHNRRCNSNNQTNYIIYGSTSLLLFFTIISGVILSSTHAYSEAGTEFGNTSSTASVSVPAFCSMTATINSAHSASITGGTYRDGIGQTTIKTFCNDPNGYAMYAIGYGNNAEGNTKLHSTALSSSFDINTGTATSGDVSNWAMQVNAVTAQTTGGMDLTPTIDSDTTGSYSTYHAVPDTYTKVAHFGSSTDGEGGVGSSVTTTYAAYISGTQPTGTYIGKVKYVLIHPSSSDAPTVTSMQNVDYWGTSVQLGQEVTAIDNRDNNTYTVARLCMEGTPQNCTKSNLWMTQNLDLTLSPSQPLTSLNTDLNEYEDENQNVYSGYVANSDGTITWIPGSTLATPAVISDFDYNASGNAVTGWSNENTLPYQARGTLNGNDVYIYTSGNDNDDTVYTSLSACTQAGHTTAECAHYKMGNYYNWTASVAMNDTSTNTGWHEIMPNSICPKGWRLPNGLTNDTDSTQTANVPSDYNKLFYTNGIVTQLILNDGQGPGYPDARYISGGFNMIRSAPYYFVRSGGINDDALYELSNAASYWSSTVVSSSSIYYLFFNANTLIPATRHLRYTGYSVRCLSRD